MLIPLKDWAEKTFSFPLSYYQLTTFAKTCQIYPPPKKVGRTWCCEDTAEFIGLQSPLTQISLTIHW